MAADGPAPDQSPTGRGDAASRLISILAAHLRVAVGVKTESRIRFYMSQVGPSNQDDLISSIFLECLILAQSRKAPITDRDVSLAADRVRQRLVREARRVVTTSAVEETAAPSFPMEEEAGMIVQDIESILRNRPPIDSLLFHGYYIEGRRPLAKFAVELGIPLSTAYRKLAEIRETYLAIRESRQPPHASD